MITSIHFLSQTFFKNKINILMKFYAVVIQIIDD